MITLHTYSAFDELRGITVYRYILECDGYELGQVENFGEFKQEYVINRIMDYALKTYTIFTKFYEYNIPKGIKHNTYKVSDKTINQLLLDKKNLQIKTRLNELEEDFK